MSDTSGQAVPPSQMRAGTDDREATAALINEAFSQGRLTADEHDERLSKCYAATTLGDLNALTADLPHATSTPSPTQTPAGPPAPAAPAYAPAAAGYVEGRDKLSPAGLRAMWISWAGVGALVILIWLLSGMGYFWPAWVIGPWGIVNLVATFTAMSNRRTDSSG